ncbi:MAG TPA: hypothetical protein VGK88_04595 [bacterium]
MSTYLGFARIAIIAVLLVSLAAGAGFGAAGGSQSVTTAAAAGIDITVSGSASIASTAPGACGTSGTTVNVKSNKAWNLQVRSDPSSYSNGKAKNGTTEMTDAFQYKGGDVSSYTAITASYGNLYSSNQVKTTGSGVDVSVNYQQCVEYEDSPGNYTIVVEYLGVQP